MTNEEKLEQARAAYHQLMMGSKRVSVRYADRTVQYTAANKNDLKTYIAELEQLIADGGTAKRGQPFEVSW